MLDKREEWEGNSLCYNNSMWMEDAENQPFVVNNNCYRRHVSGEDFYCLPGASYRVVLHAYDHEEANEDENIRWPL